MVHQARSTKAVSISLNMVIVAVICLIVLAIATYILLKNTGSFNQGANNCAGICTVEKCGQGEALEFPIRNYAASCPMGVGGESQTCCLKV